MSEKDTRHAEKGAYFQMLIAKKTGNLDPALAHMEATMEAEDINQVQKRFQDWEKKQG